MTGPLHGIIGRFHKEGSTEYRKGSLALFLERSRWGYWRLYREGVAPSPWPFIRCATRKEAIERIEYLLTR